MTLVITSGNRDQLSFYDNPSFPPMLLKYDFSSRVNHLFENNNSNHSPNYFE